MNQYNSEVEDTPPEDTTPGGNCSAGLPFPDAEVCSNQFPELLEVETALARELGVKPAQAGTPEFDQMIQNAEQSGEKLKWVITQDGELWFIPAKVGDKEIYHSVITNGGDVIAAGETEIMSSWKPGSKYITLDLTNRSGHYEPSPASLYQIAKSVFERNGICVPSGSVYAYIP